MKHIMTLLRMRILTVDVLKQSVTVYKYYRHSIHLEDHHFGAEQSKLVSKSTRSTQRLQTHVSSFHLCTHADTHIHYVCSLVNNAKQLQLQKS